LRVVSFSKISVIRTSLIVAPPQGAESRRRSHDRRFFGTWPYILPLEIDRAVALMLGTQLVVSA